MRFSKWNGRSRGPTTDGGLGISMETSDFAGDCARTAGAETPRSTTREPRKMIRFAEFLFMKNAFLMARDEANPEIDRVLT
jgi:hypothetical protein